MTGVPRPSVSFSASLDDVKQLAAVIRDHHYTVAILRSEGGDYEIDVQVETGLAVVADLIVKHLDALAQGARDARLKGGAQ